MTRRGQKRIVSATSSPGTIKLISRETKRFKELHQLVSTRISHNTRSDIEKLRQALAERRSHLRRLAISAENCQGAYQSVVEALRAIALAELDLKGKDR
jgi:hypothetical protein